MEPTKMVFYEDVYTKTLNVNIVNKGMDEKFGEYLVLDRTICHPHGGGQKGDRGKLIFDARGQTGEPEILEIIDTRGEKSGVIKHIIGRNSGRPYVNIVSGSSAQLYLDWEFRQMQMRLHSVSHLLHIFMEQAAGKALPPPKISDILENYGLNVYEEVLDVSQDALPNILIRMNDYIRAGHIISTHPDPARPGFRFWKCEEFTIPCGGTHPENSAEIGEVEATMSIKKGKTKVNFRVV